MKRLTAIFGCVLVLSAGCLSAGNEKEVAGMLPPDPGEDSIYVIYRGESASHFYYSQRRGGAFFNLKDTQTIRIASGQAVFFIEATREQTPYVLYPGDSVVIEKDTSGTYLRAGNATRQNELDFLRVLVHTLGPIRSGPTASYIKSAVTLSQRDSLIEHKYSERLAFLAGYQQNHPLRREFVAYCSALFKCCKLNEQLSLYYPGFNKAAVKKYYEDSFPVFKEFLQAPALLNQTLFRDALHNYARYYVAEPAGKRWLFLEGLHSKQLLSLWDSVSVHFTGEVQAYLQTEVIRQLNFQRFNQQAINMLVSQIQDAEYRTYVSKLLEEKNSSGMAKTAFEQEVFSFSGGKSAVLNICSADSITVIDFWASWCVPCIAELPYFEKMRERFRGKAVKFVRISIDESKASWKEAAERYRLVENSYWVQGAEQSALVSEWKVTTIPRFVIVRGRKMLDADAPRPSDKDKLVRELELLVK